MFFPSQNYSFLQVWLQLVGSEGSSRTFLLKDVNVNPGTLMRKSEDYFLATTERALGEITEVSASTVAMAETPYRTLPYTSALR